MPDYFRAVGAIIAWRAAHTRKKELEARIAENKGWIIPIDATIMPNRADHDWKLNFTDRIKELEAELKAMKGKTA